MSDQVKIACKGAAYLDVDQLNIIQGNLKELSKENYDKLKKEILELGMSEPIGVWRDKNKNNVLSGTQRTLTLRAMRKEGFKIPKVPVSFIEAENKREAQKKILALTSQYGEITRQGLREFMEDAKITFDDIKDSFRFPEISFDKFEEEFFEGGTKGLCDEDEVPELPKKPKSRIGDLYQLGDHRLLCGDSTDIKQVERLMGGEKADLWLTDPPYGVSYKSNGNEDKHREIENDNLPMDEMKVFWTNVAGNALLNCSDQAAYYWFACQGGDQMMMMMMALGDASWKVRHELIWVKDSMVMGRCDYHYKHEPILYGWKIKGKHNWNSDRKQVSVLEFPRPKKSDSHPTMKPVELIQYLMCNNTTSGQKVLDTFGGSGTTLIACEKTNRKCFMMELDPHYCDVIVERWEKFTGLKAEKISGKTAQRVKDAEV